MTMKTSFKAIYIKDIHAKCMRIQRPIIVRENQNLYGHGFEMTQHEQHLYECVQPLTAQITWNKDRTDENQKKYRNNFSRNTTPMSDDEKIVDERDNHSVLWRIDSLLLVIVCTVWVLTMLLWGLNNDNNSVALITVYLSKFVRYGNEYKMDDAGFTNPLMCFAIALLLICTSLLIGWQQDRKLRRFSDGFVLQLFLSIFLIQVLAMSMHVNMFMGQTSPSLTSWSLLWLHIASLMITLFILVGLATLPPERKDKVFETENTFWLCVVEDLNTIVCYALVYRACDSQVSIHDDTTTFFDVMCIVLIGFLQHIANILMIFHAYIDASYKDNPKNETLNNIARTRLLLFFVIGLVVIFLYLRIAPTYTEFPAGVMFEIYRSLALVAFISMNSLHSLWFELQGSKTEVSWQTSPTWKLMTTAFIALGSACLLVQFAFSKLNKTNYNDLYAIVTS